MPTDNLDIAAFQKKLWKFFYARTVDDKPFLADEVLEGSIGFPSRRKVIDDKEVRQNRYREAVEPVQEKWDERSTHYIPTDETPAVFAALSGELPRIRLLKMDGDMFSQGEDPASRDMTSRIRDFLKSLEELLAFGGTDADFFKQKVLDFRASAEKVFADMHEFYLALSQHELTDDDRKKIEFLDKLYKEKGEPYMEAFLNELPGEERGKFCAAMRCNELAVGMESRAGFVAKLKDDLGKFIDENIPRTPMERIEQERNNPKSREIR